MNYTLKLHTYICLLIFIPYMNYCLCEEEKHFRMQKLNLVWEKATKKLSKDKLKSLLTDLKYQDKEELAWKRLKADGLDKDGLKEALVRGSFKAILIKYDLVREFDTLHEEATKDDNFLSPSQTKIVFRDKKLNKLWSKAEKQGFSEDQLKILKQEFQHHQTKVDQYYMIVDKVNDGSWHKDDPSNTLSHVMEVEEGKKKWKEEGSPHQMLKEKHSQLKQGYDYLTSKIIPSSDFEEPQVSGLWELAKNASFTAVELESLKAELHHFEHRIKKYKHLTELHQDGEMNLVEAEATKRQKKLKDYHRKVEKIQAELVDRIMTRHTEL